MIRTTLNKQTAEAAHRADTACGFASPVSLSRPASDKAAAVSFGQTVTVWQPRNRGGYTSAFVQTA